MRSEKQRIQEELLPVIEALLDVIEPGWETNPDLEETPKRVSKFYGEFIGYRDNSNFTSFEPVVSGQLILVRNIPYFSLCAHHLLPFYGKVTVAYIPNPAGEVRKNKVLGLSKIPRIVQMKAHKPQMQETLASDI
ncbi:MAG: GTP cyclohydrolase I, partial [Gammaproteobacteria bacterium]|nr:GTP cyclohydrolase I [Gammaproteobacteria bacterium]